MIDFAITQSSLSELPVVSQANSSAGVAQPQEINNVICTLSVSLTIPLISIACMHNDNAALLEKEAYCAPLPYLW